MSLKVTDLVISNFCHGATSLVEAAQMVSERGVRSMETFDHFEGIEHAIIAAISPASEVGMGRRFKRAFSYGGFKVHVGPSRDSTDGKVHLTTSWYVEYGGFFDTLAGRDNAGRFCDVFDAIYRDLRRRIITQYPDAKVYLTHNYAYNRQMGLNLTVVLTPRMQMAEAA